jgi:Uma2 family endonuclease
MSSVNSSAEQRILLGNVSWSTYVALAESADNPRGRMAFDQGVLEIMSPSSTHEFIKNLIGRFVETFTLEMDIDIRSVSSTTFRRPDLEKAVEADECYYIQSAEKIRGVDEIDLSIHPAPDWRLRSTLLAPVRSSREFTQRFTCQNFGSLMARLYKY